MKRLSVFGLTIGIASAGSVYAGPTEVHMVSKGGKFFFEPATVTVKPGTTVKWINDDPSKQMHTVTSGVVAGGAPKPDKQFDSKFMMAGKTFEHVFDKAGAFDYYCLPHAAMKMVGKVIVK